MRPRALAIFAACLLTIWVINWAQPVLVPFALAVLLTFLLNPSVTWLQRWLGRATASVTVVALTVVAVTLLGWMLTQQVASLAGALPAYRQNIRAKVADVRAVSESRALARAQATLEDLQREFTRTTGDSPATPPTVITAPPRDWFGLPAWTTPLFGVAGTAALVLLLLLFMLIEYRDLRSRLLAVAGHGHLASATKAFDEAASRLSRYLLMQSIANLTFGALVGIGLSIIGVPYPLLWATLGAVLRYIPYLGPWIAAGAPTIVSLAVFPGWTQTLWTVAFFVALELFTNLVLETVLYAGAAGVSQTALIVAIAFWTWMWGPVGLLLATPLTLCLVVLGKHVPGLRLLTTLVADAPALSPDAAYYQRVLAGDQGDASDLVDEFLKTRPAEEVYDALLLPPLNYAERDRSEGRITPDEQAYVVQSTRDLLHDVPARTGAGAVRVDGLSVIGYPIDDAADAALHMLADLAIDQAVTIHIVSKDLLVSELIAAIEKEDHRLLCLATLPPAPDSRARYVVKRLRRRFPELPIVVGRWAPPAFADDGAPRFIEAGATAVDSTLAETLRRLTEAATADSALATARIDKKVERDTNVA